MIKNQISKLERFLRIFLINNYKALFHLLGIIIFISQILLLGKEELLIITRESLIYQILILLLNFFMVNFLLEHLGINNIMKEEKKNINRDK